MDFVHNAYQLSSMKSTWHAVYELQVHRKTVTKIIHKRLTLNAYKVQIVQALSINDCNKRVEHATDILGSTCIKNFINIFTIY